MTKPVEFQVGSSRRKSRVAILTSTLWPLRTALRSSMMMNCVSASLRLTSSNN
jgi:hypothetical protein